MVKTLAMRIERLLKKNRAAFSLLAILFGCGISLAAHAQYAPCGYYPRVNPVACGSVNIGSSAKCASVTWSQSGSPCSAMYPSSPTVSGDSDFTVASFSGYADLSTYTLIVQFAPKAAGARSATINIAATSNAGPGTYSVSVNGTGVQVYGTVAISPSTLPCATTSVGTNEVCGTITVTANGGSVTLSSAPFTLSGGAGVFHLSGGSCAAGGSISSGGSCTEGLTLSASNPGAYSSTITVNTSGSGSASLTTSGTVNAFQCAPDAAHGKYCLVSPL